LAYPIKRLPRYIHASFVEFELLHLIVAFDALIVLFTSQLNDLYVFFPDAACDPIFEPLTAIDAVVDIFVINLLPRASPDAFTFTFTSAGSVKDFVMLEAPVLKLEPTA
jgi:hypothetical protein